MSSRAIGHWWNIPVFVCYVIQFGLCQATTKLTSDWMEERLYLRAQCKAKCLRLFQSTEYQVAFKPSWIQASQQRNMLRRCFRNDSEQCSSECFAACDRPPNECVSSCMNQGVGCRIGCTYLFESIEPRPGQCPDSVALSAYGPLTFRSPSEVVETPKCVSECRSDMSCLNSLQKCCSIGCDRVCVQPVLNDSTPPIPDALQPEVSGVSATVLALDWSTPFTQLTTTCGPIVFILQTRICACKVLDETQLTDWQTLIMTHQFGAKLDAFEPGKMYQFRIAAVSPNGTRGFGQESEPFPKQPAMPEPPSPPRNVTDSMWRFYSSGSISVLLSWQPPVRSDLPIMEYVIYWVIDHGYVQAGGHTLEGLTQFSQTLASDRLQYVIQNLKPATSYKVQVKAVSYWHGHGRIESQPNTIFLSTQSIHPVYSHQSTPEERFKVLIRSTPKQEKSNCECASDDATDRILKLEKTFYNHGTLMAKLLFTPAIKGMDYLFEWSPQVCINSKESDMLTLKQRLMISSRTRKVTLGNLSFNCRYMVKITPSNRPQTAADLHWFDSSGKRDPMLSRNPELDDSEAEPIKYSCFCTPSCLEIEVTQGPVPANCAPPDPGPPPPPVNLTADLTGSMDYRIKWNAPDRNEPQTRNMLSRQHTRSALLKPPSMGTKYRVMWAPRVDEPVGKDMYNDDVGFSPIMDAQQSDVRIVEENQTWIELRDLHPSTFYIVRVQTLVTSETGYQQESTPVALYFVTPHRVAPTESSTVQSNVRTGLNSGGTSIPMHRFSTHPCLMAVIFFRFIPPTV